MAIVHDDIDSLLTKFILESQAQLLRQREAIRLACRVDFDEQINVTAAAERVCPRTEQDDPAPSGSHLVTCPHHRAANAATFMLGEPYLGDSRRHDAPDALAR